MKEEKTTRLCRDCGITKPLNGENFHRTKTVGFRGFNYLCKGCACEHARKLQQRVNRSKKRYQENPDRWILLKKEWVEKNPEKNKAHILVSAAIKKGILVRQACEKCINTKTHAHHDDYEKPLEVRWLCAAHHRRLHVALLK